MLLSRLLITRALAANDMSTVHPGYARRRKDLLRAGVALYELRAVESEDEKARRRSFAGSSGESLHARAADRQPSAR